MRSRFISEEIDRLRIPVAIVSGFLGSGKTTLINSLLADPSMANTAVAINEFGEIPIDHHLIDHGEDKTVVLANGCLCCNLAGDMESAIMRVFSRRENGEISRFDRLIVEPSGLAEPGLIARAILRQPILSRVFSLTNLVVTADAILLRRQLSRFSEVRDQLRNAETIILTKCDLVDESDIEQVRALVRSVNPFAEAKIVVPGQVKPHSFLSPRFLDPAIGSDAISDWLGRYEVSNGAGFNSPHVDVPLQTLSMTSEVPLFWNEVEDWFRRLRIEYGTDLLRSKGLVNIYGKDGPVVLQSVEHVVSVPVALANWPSNDRKTRFVIIGQNMRLNDIESSWHDLTAAAATTAEQRADRSPCVP